MSKQYCIRGNLGDIGDEPYYNMEDLKEDLEWYQERFPEDNFIVYEREVTEWKQTSLPALCAEPTERAD